MRHFIFLILTLFCLTGCRALGPLDGPVNDNMVLPIFFGAWVETSDPRIADLEFDSDNPEFRFVIREEGKKNKIYATGTYHIIYNDPKTQTSYLLIKRTPDIHLGEYWYQILAMRYRPKQGDQRVIILLKWGNDCGRYFDANAESFNHFDRDRWIKKVQPGADCHFDSRNVIFTSEEHFTRN